MSTPKMTVDEILEGMYLLGYSHGNTDNKSLKQGVYKDIALAKQELKKLIERKKYNDTKNSSLIVERQIWLKGYDRAIDEIGNLFI